MQYSGDDGAVHAHGQITLAAAQVGDKVRLGYELVDGTAGGGTPVAGQLEAVNRAGGVESVDAAGATVVIAESDLTGPVEKMTVAELVAFAQVKYGKTLNGKLGRKVLLDEVLGLVGSVDVVG